MFAIVQEHKNSTRIIFSNDRGPNYFICRIPTSEKAFYEKVCEIANSKLAKDAGLAHWTERAVLFRLAYTEAKKGAL